MNMLTVIAKKNTQKNNNTYHMQKVGNNNNNNVLFFASVVVQVVVQVSNLPGYRFQAHRVPLPGSQGTRGIRQNMVVCTIAPYDHPENAKNTGKYDGMYHRVICGYVSLYHSSIYLSHDGMYHCIIQTSYVVYPGGLAGVNFWAHFGYQFWELVPFSI